MRRCPTSIFLSFALLAPCAWLRAEPAEKAHLDKILQRRSFTTQEEAALNKDSDPAIDVRDLVLHLIGLPVSATFTTAETLAYHGQGSVGLTIQFSKPLPKTTTLKFDLGGTASASQDYTLSYNSTLAAGATTAQLTVNFAPTWSGNGGEKVVRLTINNDPAVVPQNGENATHILRIRQFDAGEFVGLLTFPAGSGLPSLPVRVGLFSGGNALVSFEQQGSLLGERITIPWAGGPNGFPSFPQGSNIAVPAQALGRSVSDPLKANLFFRRKTAPFDQATTAYLGGFPANDQPAVYDADFRIDDLFKAGAALAGGANPYAVTQTGRLTLQPVTYGQ